jgi:hypothetical protein
MASSDGSAVTLVSRRILPSLEDTQTTQDTVALLEDSSLSLSEAEEAETHEGVECMYCSKLSLPEHKTWI